jgi:hypothetical protein
VYETDDSNRISSILASNPFTKIPSDSLIFFVHVTYIPLNIIDVAGSPPVLLAGKLRINLSFEAERSDDFVAGDSMASKENISVSDLAACANKDVILIASFKEFEIDRHGIYDCGNCVVGDKTRVLSM